MSLAKLKRTIARMAWLNGTGPQPAPKRETPREVLARHLTRDHGMRCESEDISWVKGAWSHVSHDVTHRWTAIAEKNGKRVEITGIESITKCARYGVSLEPAGNEYYGDFVAEPNPFDCKSK